MKEMFGWVDFFTELAERIDEAGPRELNEHAKRIDWHLPRRAESERRQSDVPLFGLNDIDPLTFFSYLATRTREPEGLQEALANVRETFGVDEPVERCNDWDVLNVYNLLVAWARLADDRELLWSLFRETVAGQIEADTFESALRLQHVAIPTLSCIIFLIKPRSYLHLPGVPAYQKPYGVGTIPQQMTWEEYSATIERIRADYPGCEFFEIELFSTDCKEAVASRRRSSSIPTAAGLSARTRTRGPKTCRPSSIRTTAYTSMSSASAAESRSSALSQSQNPVT